MAKQDYESYDLNSYRSEASKKKNYSKKNKKGFRRWWRKSKWWQKTILVTFIVLLIFIVLAITSGVIWLFSIMNGMHSDEFDGLTSSDLGAVETLDKDVTNIALFGVDARSPKSFKGLSDSIMILSVDKKHNKVKITSVMRDTLTNVEGYGAIKINGAYSHGGPVLAVKTLNKLFGLDITDYATVNFYGMADIIDAVGGVDVTITDDEVKDEDYRINRMIEEQCGYMGLSPSKYYVKKAGYQHLNGLQAVAYSRIRHAVSSMGTNNDFGRTDRQRLVMQLLLEKALAMPVTSYPGLVNKLAPYVETSLSTSEMLTLAGFLADRPAYEQMRVPMKEYIINADYRATGASTVYYNLKYASKVLMAFVYDDMPAEEYIAQNGVDLTGWYNDGGTKKPSDDSSKTEPDNPPESSGTSSGSEEPQDKPDTPDTPEKPETPEKPDDDNL